MITKSEERMYQVVLGPHVTEKTVSGSDNNIHVFKVSTDSSKVEIKKAIELLFEVKIDSVRTVNVKGKAKNFGKRQGSRKDWKKAYVKLAEGHSLNIEAEA